MRIINTECCGMGEISGLTKNPGKMTADLCKSLLGPSYPSSKAFYVFNDTVRSGKGLAWAKYIRENKLGTIYETHQKPNPNSGNMLKVWVFSPDKTVMRAWLVTYKDNLKIIKAQEKIKKAKDAIAKAEAIITAEKAKKTTT